MKGKIGVQQGEKRGQYKTSKTPKPYRQIRLESTTVDKLEKLKGSTMNEKINNLLKSVDNF